MMQFLSLAWRNIWRNWRRTVIAIVAIVLGVILLLLFDGLIHGSDQAIFGNAVRLYGGNIQVHVPGFRDKADRLPMAPLADAEAVVRAARTLPQVVAAAQRIQTAGLVASSEGSFPVAITGIEPDVEKPVSLQADHMGAGRFLLAEDGEAVVIGKGLADLIKASVGDRITLVGRTSGQTMRQETLTIVGIYDLGMPEAEKSQVFLPLATAQTIYQLRGQATEVSLTLQQVGQEDAVVAALQPLLPTYELDSWATLKPEIRQTLDTKFAFGSFFGLIVVFIACIGILNILLVAVFERTREMGVLAALGMKNRQMLGLFLLEGTLIGVVGAAVGCLLGVLFTGILSIVGIGFSFGSGMGEIIALMGTRLYPSLTVSDVVGRGITIIFIAAIASLYPAWQASRQEPAAALRHV
jgi:ABC-type lipoprotein release transport system permease subunit